MKEETFLTLFLSAVLLLYMLLGGFLFQFLESENEAKSIERYVELFTRLQTKNNISMDLMYQIVQTHEQACEIGQESQENRKWDFVGSFYFSGTVITTIGTYQHFPNEFPYVFISPRSQPSFFNYILLGQFTIKYGIL